MASSPEIINAIAELLQAADGLEGIKEWNKVNSLLTLVSPGVSIGLHKELYVPYDREMDEATAYINIMIWVKDADPVQGEAQVRALAQAVRLALVADYTLGGLADESEVTGIEYATADGGKSLMLHLAGVDYKVKYYAERIGGNETPVIDEIDLQYD